LSASSVRAAQPDEKQYKLADGGGLYLLVTPKGGKYWRWDYRHERRRRTMALGVYPEVSLAAARDRHFQARQLLANGVDPSAEKQAAKRAAAGADSFEAIALEWFETKKPAWEDSHSSRIMLRLENDVLPWLGKQP